MYDPIPLTVVTGFLGSGKTTLLRNFLRTRGGRGIGIIVNELGEVGLDQDLLVHAAESVELLDRGCMCCARRSDVAKALHDLIRKARHQGENWITEAIIETSGMADPAPIIATVLQDPWLRNNVTLRGVITVLDAVDGLSNLSSHPEAMRQIAIGDVVVLTKSDLRDSADRQALESLVASHVPDARVFDCHDPGFNLADVIRSMSGSRAPASRAPVDGNPVSHATASFVLKPSLYVDWPSFTVWLSALLHCHGDRILRVKGKLYAASTGKPLIIHGVQHMMYPPVHLDSDPDDEQESWLVFITNGIGRDEIATSLDRFLDRAAPGQGAVRGAQPAAIGVPAA